MVKSLRRSELYKKIWENGISKTASELNTTIYKLKDAAKSGNIPLPDNSYWSNLHVGNSVSKLKLPNSKNDYIIDIIEKHKSTTKIEKSILIDITKNEDSLTKNKTIQEYFPNIDFKNPRMINKAMNNTTVPKTMPQKKERFINDFMDERKKEKNSYFGARESTEYINSKNYIGTIYFHKRDDIEISTNALVVTNTLLKVLNNAGAVVTLDDKNLRILFEDAKLILGCHVPSRQILVGPEDKRWKEWNNKIYIPADETIYFSLKLDKFWGELKPIRHGIDESDSDYIRRVLIKIISFIPQSREQIEKERLQSIEAAKEEKLKEIQRDKHEQAYKELNSLLNKTRAHQVAVQLNLYLEDSNIENAEKLKYFFELSDWIDGKTNNNILTDSDRQKLIDDFFNVQKSYNNPFY